jgi:hypothetical protein
MRARKTGQRVEIPVNTLKCTQKELDDLKMLVVEVGIDKCTQKGSYRLLYYCTAGGDKIP